MKALIEFQGVYHVAVHIPDEDGNPVCGGKREPQNEIHGPHDVGVTPEHTDVCPNCRELVPDSELCNPRYRHTESSTGGDDA